MNSMAEAKTNDPVKTMPEVGTMSASGAKTAGKHAPAAVPMTTPEDAEKLNEFALFMTTVKKTVVEGELIERSELPPPEESDYPNCRFTAHFQGNAIKSGDPCPKELALIIEGFENYRVLDTDSLKNGDKVQCVVISFESLPEEFQSTQQADDLNLFLLESYYVVDIRKVNSYSDDPFMPKSGIFFTDGNEVYVSVFERHINPSIPQSVMDTQKRSVQNDLKKMNGLLAEYDDDKIREINAKFAAAWQKEKEKDANGYNRVGDYVWRNIDNSFWCLPVNYTLLSMPDLLTQESLDSFAALKRVCEANGVQFIVSLVPDLHVISARVINKDFRDIPDIQTASFVKQLSEIGIETIYSSDAIIQNYNRYPFAFFYPANDHPSDTTQDVITDILSERLTRYDITSALDPGLFSEKQSPHGYGNDEKYLFPANCDIGNHEAGSAYTNREILYDGRQITLSKDAPVIVVGNSHQQTPMKYPDSVPTLLSRKLNTTVDWYRIGGYGPFYDIVIQFLTQAESFLKNKKVLVFYAGTNHLSTANQKGSILNIAHLDDARILLNRKKQIMHLSLTSNTEDTAFQEDRWGVLATAEKSCFVMKDNEMVLCKSKLTRENDSAINDNQPVVCIVPAACLPNTSCKLYINNEAQTIPCFYGVPKFFNLPFELPAGTREITVKVEGDPGTQFVIKDIQIWQ